MPLRVEVTVELGPATSALIDTLLAEIQLLRTQMSATDDALARLKADVAAEADQVKALNVYLQGLPTVIREAVTDALNTSGGNAQAMADQLNQLANTVEADTASIATGVKGAPQGPAITVTPTSLTGTAGAALTGSFTASGGASPYTFAATGAPADITVGPDGTISGTPSAAESGSFTVTATDTDGATGTATVSFDIAAAAPPPAPPAPPAP